MKFTFNNLQTKTFYKVVACKTEQPGASRNKE